ncbi:GNAT family N-acetyltransferase [Actinotignum timonense]|uniref:GNAT family N-acetyltransferase n=1 Tax=Actinotignum timonense TaxID=1870995 RepID=UPI00254A8826|nr:GNAT family N-acetyltransferase [Actinotignum timonense]
MITKTNVKMTQETTTNHSPESCLNQSSESPQEQTLNPGSKKSPSQTPEQSPNQRSSEALSWRPLTPSDIPAWAALGAADPSLLHSATERDLRDFLANPEVDPATETLALYRGDHLLAGATVSTMGDVDQDDDLDIYIGYACPDLTYLPELLSRCEQLAIGLAERSETRYSGLSVQVARDDDAEETNAALGALGYRLTRKYEVMRRPAAQIPTVHIDGVTFRAPTLADEEPLRLAHAEAFRDHYGRYDYEAASWHSFLTGWRMRLDCSVVALSEETGAVVGYALANDYGTELYIEYLGSLRAVRGRGVGGQLVDRVITNAARAGYATVGLDVDTHSSTGAGRLYTAHGFEGYCAEVTLEKRLR